MATINDKSYVALFPAMGAMVFMCSITFFCGVLSQQVNANEKAQEKDIAIIDKRLDKITDALESMIRLEKTRGR